MKWLGIMFMAALLIIAPGYGSAQQPKDTSPATQPQGPEVKGEAAGTAKSFTPAERQAYEKKTAADLDAMEQRVGDIVTKGRTRWCRKRSAKLSRLCGVCQVQAMDARNQLDALQKAPEDAGAG